MQHNLDVSQNELTHPKTMCTRCHRRLFRCKTSDCPSQTTLDNSAGQIWVKYNQANSISECSSCHHFQQQCTSGRPVKPKRGRRSKKTGLEPVSPLLSQEEDCHMKTDVTIMSSSTSTPQKRRTATKTSPMPVSKSNTALKYQLHPLRNFKRLGPETSQISQHHYTKKKDNI